MEPPSHYEYGTPLVDGCVHQELNIQYVGVPIKYYLLLFRHYHLHVSNVKQVFDDMLALCQNLKAA
jgi:hypothetical protein